MTPDDSFCSCNCHVNALSLIPLNLPGLRISDTVSCLSARYLSDGHSQPVD